MKTWEHVYDDIAKGHNTENELTPASNGFDSALGTLTHKDLQRVALEIAKKSRLKPSDRVLEIGCGNGLLLSQVSKRGGLELYGIDVSKNMIANARSKLSKAGRFHFEKADAISIPFGTLKFDLIYLHSVVQYFPNRAYLVRFLKSTKERIKPGGCLILLDVPDKELKSDYLNARNAIGEKKLSKFGAIKHLFVSKENIKHFADRLGYLSPRFFPHPTLRYKNAKYRFNLILTSATNQKTIRGGT
jgi:ubiquinone/menaquinone biosynthesis C-methylase UbiE